jgi:pimeloyl-ACP methyl ester carboxylesterase
MDLVVNGAAAFAHTGGQPFDVDRPAVVLIHGAGFDHSSWRFQSRYLAHHGVSVAAVDLPGHGRSEGPAMESVTALADWTVGVISALGVESAVVVGHSLGGLVALDAAARHEAVGGVVLIGAALPMPVHPEMLSSSAEGTTHVLSLIRAWGHGSHVGGHADPGRWLMGETWALQERIGLDVLHTDLAACDAYGGPSAIAAIGCPVLVIAGESDRMTPLRANRALVDAIPGARLEVLEAGHTQHIEQPRAVAKLIGEFVRSTAARSPA